MTSHRRKNKDSFIRATIQEHRAVLGLVNPAEKVSDMKKDGERCYPLMLRYFVFSDRRLERTTEMEVGAGHKSRVGATEGYPSGEALQRLSVMQHQVALCEYRLQSRSWHHEGDLNGARCKQGGVHRGKPGDVLEAYPRLQTCQNEQAKVCTGISESDGVATCVHYQRLRVNLPVPSSVSPVAKHEGNKKAGPTTQEVREHDFVVGANPGNTNIMTITVPKLAEDGIEGNLCQKDTRL